jgi:hypothetical protein
VLDKDVGFATGGYTQGMSVRVAGVLVPSDDRTRWELKPRALADFQVLSFAPPAGAPPGANGGGSGGVSSGFEGEGP